MKEKNISKTHQPKITCPVRFCKSKLCFTPEREVGALRNMVSQAHYVIILNSPGVLVAEIKGTGSAS